MSVSGLLNRRKLSSTILNLLGWGGGLFFVTLLWKQATSVNWVVDSVQWPLLLLSFVFLLVGSGLQSQLAWITQWSVGHQVARVTIYRVWFFSQVARYIPGSLWQVAARSIFYTRQGVPLSTAGVATLWELVATITGSLLICCLVFTIGSATYQVIALLAFFITLLGLAFYLPRFWKLLVTLRLGLARKMLAVQPGQNYVQMVTGLLLLSVLVWMIVGTGFYLFAVALGADQRFSWWEAVISFNVAYSAGFLVIVAPTGLGVREIVLSFLLAPYFSSSTLAFFVLAARLWWVAADGVHLLIAGSTQIVSQKVENR